MTYARIYGRNRIIEQSYLGTEIRQSRGQAEKEREKRKEKEEKAFKERLKKSIAVLKR